MSRCFITFAVMALTVHGANAHAQTDSIITYQGELKDNGVLANGTYNMDFSLWDAESGGNLIGSILMIDNVPVSEGRFTVELDFGVAAFDNTDRFLEIEVQGITLSPRQPITRTPYAIQTRGIYVDHVGRVGIGTTLPGQQLQVETDVRARAVFGHNAATSGFKVGVYGQNDSNAGAGVLGFATAPSGATNGVTGQSQSTEGRGVVGFASATSGVNYGVRGSTNSPDGFAGYFTGGRNYFEGAVGIGTAAPSSSLSVLGDADFSGGVAIGTSIPNNALSVVGDADVTGYFGIGTSIPNQPLHVAHAIPVVNLQDTDSTGVQQSGYISLRDSSGTEEGWFGYGSQNNADMMLANNIGNVVLFSDGHRVTLTTDGNVGIGVTVPIHRLEVEQTTPFRSAISGLNISGDVGTGVRGVSAGPSGTGVRGEGKTGVFGISDGTGVGCGVYGIATASTGLNEAVAGNCNSPDGFDFYAFGAGMDYGSSSSIRWKRNIERIDDPLYKLSKLRGVYFDWDEEHGGHRDIGFIAEEVGAVLPEIVNYEENGIDAVGMDYSRMTALLVEAVNDLHTRIESENAALRSENDVLRARLDALEERFNPTRSHAEEETR